MTNIGDKFLENLKAETQKYVPPKSAQNQAKRAIEWREKYGSEVKGGTQVGWTRARQLANGDGISLDIVKRMCAFKRHQKNYEKARNKAEFKKEPWKSRAIIAWMIWGGSTGVNWACSISKREK